MIYRFFVAAFLYWLAAEIAGLALGVYFLGGGAEACEAFRIDMKKDGRTGGK